MKKKASVLLAATLATSSIGALSNPSLADFENAAVERVNGANRYETCVNISKQSFVSSDVAIIASGQKVHDALTSGGIAAKLKAPLLLTKKDSLPDEVVNELKRLKVKNVVFVGGEQSISKTVVDQLSKTYKVQRISGKNRYETSIKLAQVLNKDSKQDNIIVNANTVDALIAGSIAAKLNRSIILTDGKNLPEGAESVLDLNSPNNIIIGGIDSLNIKGLKGDRISGSSRYETSAKLAEKYYQGSSDSVALANGTNYIDAISAVNLALGKNAPVLLTNADKLDSSVSNYLDKNVKEVYLLGGTDSISEGLTKDIESVLKTGQVNNPVKPSKNYTSSKPSNDNKPVDSNKPADNNKPADKKPEKTVEYENVKVLKDGRYEVEAPGYSKLAPAGNVNNKLIAIVEGGKIKNIEFEYHDTDMEMFKNPFNKNKDKLFDKLKNNGYFLSDDKADKLSELNTIAGKLYDIINNSPNKSSIDKINKDHGVDIVSSATYTTASLYKGSYELIKKINGDAEIKKVEKPAKQEEPAKEEKHALLSKEEFAKLDENVNYPDGVYYGDGFGYIDSKPIPLKVTVENGKIKNVEFVSKEVTKVVPEDKYPDAPDDGKEFIKGYNGVISLAKEGQINRLHYFLKSAREPERKVESEVKKTGQSPTLEMVNRILDSIFSKHEFGSSKQSVTNSHFDTTLPHVLGRRLNYLVKTYMNEELGYKYNVDTISGATYTATGTAEAISNALKKADPSVNFTDLTIAEDNGLKASYTGGSEIDFNQIGFKAEMLKKGETSPVKIPFSEFGNYGIKLYYVNHANGELKEINGKLSLTKESLGYDTKRGLSLRLVHEATNTVKLVKPIQIFDNTKVVCTVEKVQVSEADKDDWKDVNGFDATLDPTSKTLNFSQKLTMPEGLSSELKGKKLKFRLLTRRDDNQQEKIFNLKSSSEMVWPVFDASGYYSLSVNKEDFTSGHEQYRLDQAGIDNFRFAFNGIKSGDFKEAVDKLSRQKYDIRTQTISINKEDISKTVEELATLARTKLDANVIKDAFQKGLMNEKEKALLEEANPIVDYNEVATAIKAAETKSQAKFDVKFEFGDGSSYMFRLPVYFDIKKAASPLKVKFEEAINSRHVQLVQKLPTNFNGKGDGEKERLVSFVNTNSNTSLETLTNFIKNTYEDSASGIHIKKVEIDDSEIAKINTNLAGTYVARVNVTLDGQPDLKEDFNITFEVVKYQVVGFHPRFNKPMYNKTTKLAYGPSEIINIARDKGPNPNYLGYWLTYSNVVGPKGVWNIEEIDNISANNLDDLKLFPVAVVKGDKEEYTNADIVDLTKPAGEILNPEGTTKLYLYNFGTNKKEGYLQKVLIGEFTLTK
nr:cell wall-binding repeat-containing protein [uncultured Peptostreptococcus sp.]